MKEKSAAVLTIYSANNMTSKGKEDIAKWLNHCAKEIVKNGHNYSTRFRARYQYYK